MFDFIIGLATGIWFTSLLIGIVYTHTKSYRTKDLNYDRYLLLDFLWLHSSKSEPIPFVYDNKSGTLYVKSSDICGTNGDAKMLQLYINDTYCGCCLKCFDGASSFKVCYTESEYDSKEIWNILESVRLNLTTKTKKVENTKKSILGE